MQRIVFITGTDTGVGKTVLTALLLLHLRQRKIRALALKPFCSGSRADVDLLQSLQPGELSDELMNPYFYPLPLAPLAAARGKQKNLVINEIQNSLTAATRHTSLVLIEGAGGLMVPISRTLFISDLIAHLDSEVLLVAKNQLGTINHTLLSVECLRARGVRRIKVVLMDVAKPDLSSKRNKAILSSLLPGISIFSLPFFYKKPNKIGYLQLIEKKFKKTLARMVLDN